MRGARLGVMLPLLAASAVFGHGGGLDDRGCHNDRQAGDYHCHDGPHAGKTFASEADYPGDDDHSPQGYDRDAYPHWIDADGDCQDTRQEVLIEQASGEVALSPDGCRVEAGRWRGPYTGEIFTDPGDLHIDHVVPLANAHAGGAADWSTDRRRRFANDPDNLLAVDAGANLSKGDSGPDEWLPEVNRCRYVEQWVAVKEKWGLEMDRRERQAVQQITRRCE